MPVALILSWLHGAIAAHWRALCVTACVLALYVAGRCAGQASMRGEIAAGQRAAAKAVVASNVMALARVDTVLVRDTVRVSHLLRERVRDTLWRHDTVRVAGDTTTRLAIPLVVVARQDSTTAACQNLVQTCTQFRTEARATIASLEVALAARPATCAPSHWLAYSLLGAAGGFAAAHWR